MTLRAGIIGLGRIGRGVLRANYSQFPEGRFDIKVICDVMTVDQVAYLLAHDSTYGAAPFTVECDETHLIVGGKPIAYRQVDRRRPLPEEDSFGHLREFGLDVLLDATGTASIDNLRSLVTHKTAKKVVCTINLPGCDLSLVYGVNHKVYNPDSHHVISASTCTGNAVTPVLAILEKHIGIDNARLITIHPLLSDQRVLDGYHSTSHLGRACATSILPTRTQVANSAELVLPSLAGKLDSISYRIPTAIVSALDVTAYLSRPTTREECIELFNHYAQSEDMPGIINCDSGAWGHEKASIDFLGTPYSVIILMNHLTLTHGRQLGLALMHDNEFAYCMRVLDVFGVLAAT
ncbi:aldehyde dehydrogenase [Methylicorpusculum oleiharenae]|uniref:glyceraldehyde 3-phosphate dehydrogenase NAD-binding domain-containing protein n=1 Tax=Methylicorpusculum oleiharenae TaxID=1338687 RepID=UPI0013574A52|nr:glyceraldehyde 3-phosphate dehydrogenase NAD-binding domain-containing protein [Methylicorpusculum oleiharenae]MCD2450295.1 aldehyde dehydrogenase [Methylicorpusculum oleiharenae]